MKQSISSNPTPSIPATAGLHSIETIDNAGQEPDHYKEIEDSIGQLATLGYPGHTPFDVGRFIGRVGKLLIPKYESVHNATELGIKNPRTPFVHIPERTDGYTFGWRIDENVLVTAGLMAFTDPAKTESGVYVVTGEPLEYDEWVQHNIEARFVSDWLKDLCNQAVTGRPSRIELL